MSMSPPCGHLASFYIAVRPGCQKNVSLNKFMHFYDQISPLLHQAAKVAQSHDSEPFWGSFAKPCPKLFKMSFLKRSGTHLVDLVQNCSK